MTRTIASPDPDLRFGLGIFRYRQPCGVAWGHGGIASYQVDVHVAREGTKAAVWAVGFLGGRLQDSTVVHGEAPRITRPPGPSKLVVTQFWAVLSRDDSSTPFPATTSYHLGVPMRQDRDLAHIAVASGRQPSSVF